MGARPVTTVIVGAIVLGFPACGQGDDDRAVPSTAVSPASTSSTLPAATTTTSSAPTTTARAIDYSRASAATQLTTGLLDGASPDGSTLHVSAVDPAKVTTGATACRWPSAGSPLSRPATPAVVVVRFAG